MKSGICAILAFPLDAPVPNRCQIFPVLGSTGDEAPWRSKDADDPLSPREVLPDIDADLDRMILRGVARLPGDRYQSAAEMLADQEGLDWWKRRPALQMRAEKRGADSSRMVSCPIPTEISE
jgi:hypothetical protein